MKIVSETDTARVVMDGGRFRVVPKEPEADPVDDTPAVDIIEGMPAREYHAADALSSTRARRVLETWAHFEHVESVDSRAAVIGTAVHTVLLEPHRVDEELARPYVPPRGALVTSDDIKARLRELGLKLTGRKADLVERLREADPAAVFADDAFAAWERETAGKSVLSESEWETVEACADAVRANAWAARFIDGASHKELSIFWDEPGVGRCKARPDLLYPVEDHVYIVDLKTTSQPVSPDSVGRLIANRRWATQVAWYARGCAAAGFKVAGAVFIVASTSAPYLCEVYRLAPVDATRGAIDVETILQRIAAGPPAWHGYSRPDEDGEPGLPIARLPRWAWNHQEYSR